MSVKLESMYRKQLVGTIRDAASIKQRILCFMSSGQLLVLNEYLVLISSLNVDGFEESKPTMILPMQISH